MSAGHLLPLDRGVLRVLRADGEVAGAGFLVTDRLAVTCAHVIGAGGVGDVVRVDTGLVGGAQAWATVREWLPEQDVAVLWLADPLPDALPVPLVETLSDLWGHSARTFGFPAGHERGIWHPGVLRQRQGNGWIQFERAVDGGFSVSQGFSGAPVWDDQLAAVVGMVVAFDAGNPVAFLIPTTLLVEAAPGLQEVVGVPSPFPGLSAFQESDAEFFFGREAESGEIAGLALDNSLVTVLGASGCGKSSVVRAGVMPRLRTAGFATVVVRNGHQDLLGGLAAELTALTQPEVRGSALRTEIRESRRELAEGRLADLIDEVCGTLSVRGLVVGVDQLEELLTRGDQVADIAVLFPEDPPPALRVLTTLRADFLEPVEEHPVLRRALRGSSFLLTPMTPAQLREAVARPVERVPAVEYEPGLVDRILADVGDAPGVLPLLGFTLGQLWREQRAGRLTQEAYTTLGGVHGALARRAEEAWASCVSAGKEAEKDARRLVTRLIRLPLGTRSAVRRTVVRAELEAGEWSAAQTLAAERLLVIGVTGDAGTAGVRQETVELAHEALINAWPRLAGWAEQDRDFLTWRERLRQDRERWEAAGQADDLLPGPTALDAAEQWETVRRRDLDPATVEFLARGRARRQRKARRRRRLFVSFGTVVALIVVFASLFVYQTRVSQVREAESDSRSLAAASADALTTEPSLAIMYALAAYQRSPTDVARDALLQAYLAYSDTTGNVEAVMSGALGGIRRIAASANGRTILVTGAVGRATLFARDNHGRIHQEPLPFERYAVYPFVSPGGERAGYVAADGALVWYKLGDPDGDDLPAKSNTISGPDFPMNESYTLDLRQQRIAVSADGSRVAVASADNRLFIWNLDTQTQADTVAIPTDFTVDSIWFGPDHDTVLADVIDGTSAEAGSDVLAVDLVTGKFQPLVENVSSATVSGDGSTVAYCQAKKLRVVKTTDGVVRHTVPCEFSSRAPALDYSGRYVSDGWKPPAVFELAKAGKAVKLPEISGNPLTEDSAGQTYGAILQEGDRHFLLVATPTAMALLEQPDEPEPTAIAAGLTPDGDRVISYIDDGQRIRLTEVSEEGRQVAVARRQGATFSPTANDPLRISRDGRLLADQMTDHRVVIRDLESLRPLADLRVEPPKANPHPNTREEIIYFFLDNRHLVTLSGSVVEQWNARTGDRVNRVDLADLNLLSDDPLNTNWLSFRPYPKANHIAVTNGGSDIRVVNLRQAAKWKTCGWTPARESTSRCSAAPGTWWWAGEGPYGSCGGPIP